MARERAWRVKVEGFDPITTSELTLDEAVLVEKVCGTPWILLNPLASVAVAKGLCAVLLKRSQVNAGATTETAERRAIEAAGKLTVGQLHGAFEFLPGEAGPTDDGGEESSPPSLAITSATG